MHTNKHSWKMHMHSHILYTSACEHKYTDTLTHTESLSHVHSLIHTCYTPYINNTRIETHLHIPPHTSPLVFYPYSPAGNMCSTVLSLSLPSSIPLLSRVVYHTL